VRDLSNRPWSIKAASHSPAKIQKVAYKTSRFVLCLHRDKEIKLVPLEMYILSTYV
jgi:hypothetical protein